VNVVEKRETLRHFRNPCAGSILFDQRPAMKAFCPCNLVCESVLRANDEHALHGFPGFMSVTAGYEGPPQANL
jgi:hypothetical protein